MGLPRRGSSAWETGNIVRAACCIFLDVCATCFCENKNSRDLPREQRGAFFRTFRHILRYSSAFKEYAIQLNAPC